MSAASIATSVPAAHGDADVRLRQCRGVVQAVTHHRHDAALLLKPADLLELPVRQHLGHHSIDPDFACHRLGGPAIVAGEQHYLEPHSLEPLDRLALVGLTGSAIGDEPRRRPSTRDEHRRLPGIGALGRMALQRRGRNTELGHQRGVAHRDPPSRPPRPERPCPDRSRNRRRRARRLPRRSASATIASASGCSLSRSTDAASRRTLGGASSTPGPARCSSPRACPQ